MARWYVHVHRPTRYRDVSSIRSNLARITRGSMIETLNSNFIRTARAKGLSYRYIVLKHALKPAMLPCCLQHSLRSITGSVVVETIFAYRVSVSCLLTPRLTVIIR